MRDRVTPATLEHIYYRLGNIERLLVHIYRNSETEMTALTDLQAQVAANTTVEQSAVTLIAGLKTALDAAIAALPTDDGAALTALSVQLGTDDTVLAAAITANTPAAAPTPTPAP